MSRATPLLAPSNEELTLDEWLLKSRSSCLSPMVCAFVAAGMVGYAWPSMPVLMPAYLDRTILNETDWFVDAHVGVNAMSGTSTALFALWGPGTMLFTAISDRSGRRPIFFAMVFCTLALTTLSALAFGAKQSCCTRWAAMGTHGSSAALWAPMSAVAAAACS